MQIKVEKNTLIIYDEEERIKKRIERVERMKNRENKRKSFKESFLARDAPYTRDGKPFYRLSKLLPLMLN